MKTGSQVGMNEIINNRKELRGRSGMMSVRREKKLIQILKGGDWKQILEFIATKGKEGVVEYL